MRFCIWNLSSLYRSGSLWTICGNLARHKLDLGDVQAVKWDTEGPVGAGDFIYLFIFWAKETKIIS